MNHLSDVAVHEPVIVGRIVKVATDARSARAELTNAFEQFEREQSAEAIARFDAASAARPGSQPMASLHARQDALKSLCKALPTNLTARNWYAGALHADKPEDAYRLYVSIIRDARPSDKFASLKVSRAPFDAPRGQEAGMALD